MKIVDYMESLKIHVPKYANPADFYLDVLMEAKKTQTKIAFSNENYQKMLAPEIEQEILALSDTPFSLERKKNSFLYEMEQVSRRSTLNFLRYPMFLKGRLLSSSEKKKNLVN